MVFAGPCYRCGDYGWLTGWAPNPNNCIESTIPITAARPAMPLIQIFAKPPVAGKVKTRLIPDLGVNKATDVYRYCLTRTLELIQASSFNYEIWLGGQTTDPIFNDQQCYQQQGDNLGTRVFDALSHGLSGNLDSPVILIGSDCLDLTRQHLNQAAKALEHHDLVLLPCFDGGFALIGCRKIDAALFEGVEWSSPRVLKQTLKNAEALDYRVHLLETVRDIDTLADLNHYPVLRAIADRN